MTWTYLGWGLAASLLALLTSELLRAHAQRRREALFWASMVAMLVTLEVNKERDRNKP